jgi:regulatory protein
MADDGPARLSVSDFVRMAQAYLVRRAASRQQLKRVLLRKARRLTAADSDVDAEELRRSIDESLDRVVRAGLIDDDALARVRTSAFVRKGLPGRRVKRTLQQQGLDPGSSADELDALDDETQARRYAERKRLGPFATGRRPPSPERDLRALVRAGFSPDIARRVMRDLAGEAAASGTTGHEGPASK